MPIYDLSYAHWKGKLESRVVRWMPITQNDIKLPFRSKLFLVFCCLALIPFITRMAMVFVFHVIPDVMWGAEFAIFCDVNATFIYDFFTFNQLVSIIYVCLFVGCGLISKDLEARALEIYFSKPLSVMDYLAGKLGGMLFFLFCMTLFPGLLVILADLMLAGTEGAFGEKMLLLARMVGVAMLISMTCSLVVLAASSLAKSARNAAIVWFGFHIILQVTARILAVTFNLMEFKLIDPLVSIRFLSRKIFGVNMEEMVIVPQELGEVEFAIHWGYPALYILAINVAAFWLVLRRVRRVEAMMP